MKTSLIFASLILGILLVSLVSAETLVSDAGVNYESEILEEFNKTSEVMVIVRLKDTSNITVEGTTEEIKALFRQKDEWFNPVIDSVLSTLPETEFKIKYTYFNGFAGKITKEGLDKLIKNPAAKMIYLSRISHVLGALEESFPEEVNATKNLSISENGSLVNASIRGEGVSKEKTEQKSWLYNLLMKIVQFIKSLFSK